MFNFLYIQLPLTDIINLKVSFFFRQKSLYYWHENVYKQKNMNINGRTFTRSVSSFGKQ